MLQIKDLRFRDGTNGIFAYKIAPQAIFQFQDAANGVFLTKLDGTAKGGVALSISVELSLPVWFIGTGEEAVDMSAFDADAFAEAAEWDRRIDELNERVGIL